METKKIKIEIKNRFTGKVLFEYEKENNTVKDTVIEAVRKGADLRGADLGGAYLRGADLRGAYLRGADLRVADLGGADLRGADLRGADLRGADLRGAYLRGAYLGYADLRGADLRGADLGYADLGYAYLRGAYLRDAKDIPFIPIACPSDGAFIGWKKVHDTELEEDYLVKLEICDDSKRSSASGTKCRCDKAKVLEITEMETGEKVESVINTNYRQTVYKVGEMVEADEWDENRWEECSHGIHFFINRQEAVEYEL